MNIDKVRSYLFIAYEMYVKERTKEWLNKRLDGFELVLEIDDFERWLKEEFNI